MQAVTIRAKTTRALIAFGPADGMYDPGFNPETAIRTIEPDYATVFAEWQQTQPIPVDRNAHALADPAVPQWFKDYLA